MEAGGFDVQDDMLPENAMNRHIWMFVWLAIGISVILAGCSGGEQELIRLLEEGAPQERAGAARTLAEYGADITLAALTPLRGALSDRAARTPAASALGEMGAAARPAVPDLLRGVDDPDPMFRAVAVWAAVRIDPADARVRAVLERFEAGSDPLMRKVAKAGLARGRR